MKRTFILILSVLAVLPLCGKTLDEINIRDPFIFADHSSGNYYMYCSMSKGKTGGVGIYSSKDLVNWDGPEQMFVIPSDNWATGRVWAPEVHYYNGRYYLFITITSHKEWRRPLKNWGRFNFRGTQIFVGDSASGPFEPLSSGPQTPLNEMALDGTLWDENGTPYIVYCQEWLQSESGNMKYCELSYDLSTPIGMPKFMFCAEDAPWNCGADHGEGLPKSYVTDGPSLIYSTSGALIMLWSGFSYRGYAVGLAISRSGRLSGPWDHQRLPVYSRDGGHPSFFWDFQDRLRLVLHTPNNPGGAERAKIFYVEDCGNTLRISE